MKAVEQANRGKLSDGAKDVLIKNGLLTPVGVKMKKFEKLRLYPQMIENEEHNKVYQELQMLWNEITTMKDSDIKKLQQTHMLEPVKQ